MAAKASTASDATDLEVSASNRLRAGFARLAATPIPPNAKAAAARTFGTSSLSAIMSSGIAGAAARPSGHSAYEAAARTGALESLSAGRVAMSVTSAGARRFSRD